MQKEATHVPVKRDSMKMKTETAKVSQPVRINKIEISDKIKNN